jgi:hypothetical protein
MPKIGRNDTCACGSGQKYKKCCEAKDRTGGGRSTYMLLVVGGAVLAAVVVAITSFTSDRSNAATRIWSSEHGHYHDANGVQVP